ncbi:hypothetical protein B5807_03950 [Epicoccum nigrum]|jgi:hypothetical protein|uniref:F-box domain-containing protein n=1 Tax=Epicoccum nigrum TaxID=105696 RepID=A0A1Y2M8E0_EPING|nr:hypothetical protein B5807_03950 [Epicoccum nigrum]
MSLLALPHELLQHIARFLPCSSLLRLIRVNHQLRDACNDPILLKYIVQNAFYRTPGAIDGLVKLYNQPGRVELQPEQLCWPEGEHILNTNTFDENIRIALAIEDLIRLATLKPAAWLISTTSNMAAWLPHLLALHHPASLGLEPEMFLLPHGQLSQTNTSLTSSLLVSRWLSRTADQARDRIASAKLQALHFTNFSFILNYTLLQRLGSTINVIDFLAPFVNNFVPDWRPTDPNMPLDFVSDVVIQRMSERVPKYGSFIRDFDLTQASAALSLVLVAVAFQYGNSTLPAPTKIPFVQFMDIPSAHHNSAELFTTCHYRRMITPEFLSGMWHGYYTDHRSFQHLTVHVDPAMRAIQMVVQPPTEEARTRLRISAVIDRETRGYDAHGDFRLSGRVREDGLVSLAKQYLASGNSWTWTGRMTPFGIVGVWGHNSQNSFGGYFWLFKDEWMVKQ